jgi:hypothetical protein
MPPNRHPTDDADDDITPDIAPIAIEDDDDATSVATWNAG